LANSSRAGEVGQVGAGTVLDVGKADGLDIVDLAEVDQEAGFRPLRSPGAQGEEPPAPR